MLETVLERSLVMPKKRFSPEQIVTLLRQIEVTMGQAVCPRRAAVGIF